MSLDNDLRREPKKFILWTLRFTKIVVTIVTILFVIDRIFDACAIGYAMVAYNNFSFLDSYITDNGETFRQIVGLYIISKTIENVFKYNDGGIFGKSIKENKHESSNEAEG